MWLQRPRPKLELAFPYGSYRLTSADGAPLERTEKHPFCMSRCVCVGVGWCLCFKIIARLVEHGTSAGFQQSASSI